MCAGTLTEGLVCGRTADKGKGGSAMSDDFAAKLENPIWFDAVYLFSSDQEEYEIRKILENISREDWISKYRRQEFLEWLKTEKNGFVWLLSHLEQ